MPEEPQERRVIGRILSIGFPLPGVRVDNYNICSAPSFFDYDALVIDPHAVSAFIENVIDGAVEAKTFGGRPVRNEARASGDVSLADALLRRRDETRQLLARGGAVACFAHPPDTHTRIHGIDALDDYFWLGEHAPTATPAEGTQAAIVDYQHAMAAFVLGQVANVSYRASVGAPRPPATAPGAAAESRSPGALRVFARSHGGAAIGAEYAAGEGRIVMLPALRSIPSGDGRYAMSDALQAGLRQLLDVTGEGRAPAWLSGHPLPGLEDAAAAAGRARKDADAAQAALAEAEARHEEIARYQRLLWQEGRAGLEPVVLDALRLLGFSVYASDPENVELRADGAVMLIEIEGSDGAVGLAPHYRLRQRIEREIQRRSEAPRGLLFINGHRHKRPADRSDQASPELRLAAETMRYGIATTAGLFAAVAAKLAGKDDAVAAYREHLMTGTGLFEQADAQGAVAPDVT